MTLLDLHVELAVTNELLKRIADALDRAVPIVAPSDHSAHPLIGLADISRLTPERAAQREAERATLPVRASERVRFSNSAGGAADQAGTVASEVSANAGTSRTGQWDHEDPLDGLDELGRSWPNYSGVDS